MTALITPEGLARLDAALAWIDEHPEQHNQDVWIARESGCGTTCCLAGALAQLAGGSPIWEGDTASEVRLPGGAARLVDEFAAELLGVPYEGVVAEELFYGSSNRDDLREARDRLAASLEPSP
jgi:hypothetical protein